MDRAGARESGAAAWWRLALRQPIAWLILYLLALHGLMGVFDALHPSSFMNCDRSFGRLAAAKMVGAAFAHSPAEGAAALSRFGMPGDYAFHGLLLASVGRAGVIVVQVALMIASVFGVYAIGGALGLSKKSSLAAAALYAHLPHTLIFPHQLASEAFSNPLIVLSFWALLAQRRRDAGLRSSLLGGAAIGFAALVRPVVLLWPLVQATLLLFMQRRPVRAAAYAAIALAPVMAFMTFMLVQTGQFSTGSSEADGGHNLYMRVVRTMEGARPEVRADVERRWLRDAKGDQWGHVLPTSRYAEFVVSHPSDYLRYLALDGAAFAVKSGVEKVTVDYLDLLGSQKTTFIDRTDGWRPHFVKEGFAGGMRYVMANSPVVFITSGLGAVALVALDLLALVGIAAAVFRWRSLDRAQVLAWISVALFPLYVFTLSQAVDTMQSRHRAPAEFAYALLAVQGAVWLYGLASKRRPAKGAALEVGPQPARGAHDDVGVGVGGEG